MKSKLGYKEALMKRRFMLAGLLGLLLFLSASGNTNNVTKEKLIEDIDTYTKFISRVHADPWRFIKVEDFYQKAEQIKKRIQESKEATIPIFDCFFYLDELAAAIKDSHTMMVLPMQHFTGTEPVFPFLLKIIDDKVFVVKMFEGDSLPLYCQILGINQMTIETYREIFKSRANTNLQHVEDLMFEVAFPIMLGLYFKQNPPWEVKYQLDNQVQTVDVQGMSAGEYMPFAMGGDTRYREYSIDVDGITIPVLDIPSFSYGEEKDYDAFIDEFFQRHKKAKYLVIDLRENSGGSGYWGYYLLDYLVDSPYLIAKDFTFKVSDTMRKSGYASKAGDLIHKAKDGEYLTVQKNRMQTPHKSSGRFEGQVFCLISKKTFSAGAVAAAIFQANKMGITVGQETMGTIRFCSDPVNVTLPNTQLEAQIPLAIYTLPGGNPDRGVIPDIKVARMIDDYRKGVDKEMLAVEKLIRENRLNDK
jgi:hypothetical protein